MTAPAPTLDLERELARRSGPGRRVVVGLDEVGRGALAGPVAVGAVAVAITDGQVVPLPDGVRDSKKLTARRREALVDPIREAALAGAVGWAEAAEIDEIGIMPALTRAALRALEGLGVEADALLLDGDVDVLTPALTAAERPAPLVQLRVAADRDCASVSAASIMAKVARDARMVALHEEAPEYGWASNKGYGAAVHRTAIDRIGVHEHHRRSWRLGSAPAAGRSAPAGRPAPGTRPAVTAAAPDAGARIPATVTGPGTGPAGVLWEGPWSTQDEEERR